MLHLFREQACMLQLQSTVSGNLLFVHKMYSVVPMNKLLKLVYQNLNCCRLPLSASRKIALNVRMMHTELKMTWEKSYSRFSRYYPRPAEENPHKPQNKVSMGQYLNLRIPVSKEDCLVPCNVEFV